MGLAGPKKQARVKLSHDPNNTTWTNDTQSFGHRMMTSQGWSPGQYLGVQNSAHSEFHTAANASHIRVAIKDDNLGLGAKIGSGVGHGECTGLDAFKDVLGRLNGKEEGEIQKEIRDRDDLKRAIYTERKWGSIRFVRGGLLVGDKIQDLIEGEKVRMQKLEDRKSDPSNLNSKSKEVVVTPRKDKKSKKRKAEVLAEPVGKVVAVKVKKSKKPKKSESYPEDEVSKALEEVKISKKSKKDRKLKDKSEEPSAQSDRKKQKRKKEERKAQKAMRKAKKDKENSEAESSQSSVITTKENTPVVVISTQTSGRSTPKPMMQGRHAVRSRNIAQKRLAAMDSAALNQIFMIKS